MAPSCAVCGHVFRREAGAQTGSMYVTATVTQVFAVLLIGVVWLTSDLSTGWAIALCVPPVLAFCFLFLPYSQAFWVGVEYLSDLHNGEAWVKLRRSAP